MVTPAFQLTNEPGLRVEGTSLLDQRNHYESSTEVVSTIGGKRTQSRMRLNVTVIAIVSLLESILQPSEMSRLVVDDRR